MLAQQNVVIDEDGWPAVGGDLPPGTDDLAACSHDGASVNTASVDETAKTWDSKPKLRFKVGDGVQCWIEKHSTSATIL